MQQNKYLNILPDFDSEEKSLTKIGFNLEKAKEKYKLMKKDNFLTMYPLCPDVHICHIYFFDHNFVISKCISKI